MLEDGAGAHRMKSFVAERAAARIADNITQGLPPTQRSTKTAGHGSRTRSGVCPAIPPA
jgi:hypothetical protein